MRRIVARRLSIAVVLGLVGHVAAAAAQVQAPTVTVGGVGYVNYGYQLKQDSSLAAGVGHGNNFDVGRAYVNVNGKFAEGVTTRVTTDVDGRAAAAGQLSIRLKYAFVAWQPHGVGPLTYKVGMIHTPWVDFEETMWDYRMQGTTAMDRNSKLTSSDIGAGVDGMWHYDQFAIQVGAYNGEGYSGAPGDQGKDIEARASYRLAKTNLPGKVGGLRLSGYAGLGKLNGGGTRNRFLGMLSYKSKTVTLAAEIATTEDSIGTGATALPHQKGQLMTAFGVFNVDSGRVGFIARVDTWDPNKDSVVVSTTNTAAINTLKLAQNKQTRVIIGVSYVITPNLRVLLDADLNSLQNALPNSAFDRNRQTLFFHTEFKF